MSFIKETVHKNTRSSYTRSFASCTLTTIVVGLVEELVVDNDPEYQWMDNFRQARKSNESRQSLLFKLDATVRRQLGKKVRTLKTLPRKSIKPFLDREGVLFEKAGGGRGGWGADRALWVLCTHQRVHTEQYERIVLLRA